MYQSARGGRLTGGWGGSNTSADAELSSSLLQLRSRSRALVRDAAYAKRAKRLIQNNVVGWGIGYQARVMTTRDKLNETVNADLEAVWTDWCRATNCDTAGAMHFADIERAIVGQVFEAGEVFIRKHYRAFGESKVPFALELIEPERIADETQISVPSLPAARGAIVRMGIECDEFYRPIAYYIRERHPGELMSTLNQSVNRIERVPADQIIHLRIVERRPQMRGEPWLHAVARKLNDMDGYSEAEIVAARGAASYLGTIEQDPEAPPSTDGIGETQDDGSVQIVLEAGTVQKLAPGQKFNFVAPNRPNSAMDPFMRLMLREVAAGVGTSYESLSRDYSQSNYSSSRLSLLDDRDTWRVLQWWFLRSFRYEMHRDWLNQAVLSRAVASIDLAQYANNTEKFLACRFKPRGWGWIDPTKEVEAYVKAINAGLTTLDDVISQTAGGMDFEDVVTQRVRELEKLQSALNGKQLIFETSPEAYLKMPVPGTAAPPPPDGSEADTTQSDPQKRVVSFQR